MHESLCLCALIPRIVTRTRLTLVIHRYEARKPTNSGRLAVDCLVNSEIRVRGYEGEPSQPFEWDESVQPLLLFPAEDAVPLTQFANCSKPVSLVVPDGTWRQASKVRARVPGLSGIPCVTLPPGVPTRYRLRTETHDQGLGTMEAISRAMGILEGEHVEDALARVFVAMVERTLWLRGELDTALVTTGIPDIALKCNRRPLERPTGSGDIGED
jgi:DTW domain-containing protein YfiP